LAGKSGGAIGFALNFLWLLSLFQDKESNITFLSREKVGCEIYHDFRLATFYQEKNK